MFGISSSFMKSLEQDHGHLDPEGVMKKALEDFERDFPERTLTLGGQTVHYHVQARPARSASLSLEAEGDQSEKTLLILPGTTGRAANYFTYFGPLAKQFRVIGLNYPLVSSVEEAVEVAAAVLAEEGVEDYFIYGHSIGGIVAQALLKKHQNRVQGIILAHTYGKSAKVPTRAYQGHIMENTRLIKSFRSFRFAFFRKGFAKRIAAGIRGVEIEHKAFWAAFTQEIFVSSTSEEMKSNFGMMLYFWEKMMFNPSDFEDWRGRALIMESGIDCESKRPEKEILMELFPQTELHVLPGSSNMSIVRNQEAFLSAILRFSENS